LGFFKTALDKRGSRALSFSCAYAHENGSMSLHRTGTLNFSDALIHQLKKPMPNRNQTRKTKIVATVGPACDNLPTLEGMLRAGMSVARLNLSHGTLEEHKGRLDRIREAAANLDTQVAIMIDTRGIEVRSGRIVGGSVELVSGDEFTLYTDGRPGDATGVGVTYQRLAQEVNPGDTVLLDDGAMELSVESLGEREVGCRVIVGGTLRENKGVNLPDTQLSISAVDPENRIGRDLLIPALGVPVLVELPAARQGGVDAVARVERHAGKNERPARRRNRTGEPQPNR